MMKTYQNHAMTDAEARQALADACKQVETNLPLYTYQCQNHSSVNDIYPGCANNQWTCGFWPGEIWLAYEATGDEKFKTAALIQVDSFADRIARKVEVDHHDMGFLYSPTCVAAWKLVGSETGKNAAIAAADQLLTRYQPSGRFLQAWGTMDDPGNYRYIIDCMLNVPLLYWAAQVTGSDHYREIAAAHTATTLANSFRPDGSTYHTFFMNPDGTPKGGRTCQGYKDDSFWARGQAWGVYGSAIGYTYTHDEKFLDVFRKALEFYLSRLPEDMIPCWDMLFQQKHPDAFVVRTLLYLSVTPEIVLSQLLDQLPEIVSVAVQHRHLMALLHPLPCDVVNRRGVPQQIFPLGVWVKCRYDQNLHCFSPAAMDKNASAQGFQL